MGLHDSIRLWKLTHVDMTCECVNGNYVAHALIQMFNCTSHSHTAYLIVCLNCDQYWRVFVPFDCRQFDLLVLDILTNKANGELYNN